MEMTGEQLIPASQADTWAALNDPEVLKACVPGCEAIDRVSDNQYAVRLTARIGPVAAKFRGSLLLSEVVAPDSYTMTFEGQGGVAGFAKGSASVRLLPHSPRSTTLSFRAKANVGGKLAQIGSRLVDAAAQKVASDFFTAFNERMAGLYAGGAHAPEEAHHIEPVPRDPDLPDISGTSLAFFAAGSLVVFVIALLTLL